MPKSRSKKTKSSLRKSKVNRNKTPNSVNSNQVVARCMKCREQKTMQNAKLVTLKNGRNAMKGNCLCGTKMFKFV